MWWGSPIWAVLLIQLTLLDGTRIDLNPVDIVLLRQPNAAENRQVHENANCVLFTVDGKYWAVRETCSKVRELIDGTMP